MVQLCWYILKEKREERIQIKKRTREEKEMEKVTLEMDFEYSHNLEIYLDKVHLQLVKACARRVRERKKLMIGQLSNIA